MAKSAPKDADAGSQPSMASFIIAMLTLTGLGIGAGGLFGLQVLGRLDQGAEVATQKPAPQDAKSALAGGGVNLKALPTIVTNLASPERTWIRLEASLVVPGDGKDADGLAGAITEDFVAFLRTVTLAQIEGASGFIHLREDLNERIRVRSDGKVRDLLIHTLIVE